MVGTLNITLVQGMGYLHHKNIVHKDLKTKNIFLENGRAIITDFGLVNVARRLCGRHKAGEGGGQRRQGAGNGTAQSTVPSVI